jgi:hypothetical protein
MRVNLEVMLTQQTCTTACPPFAMMLRDWGVEEEKERAEQKEREQKKHEHEHDQKYEGKGKGKGKQIEEEQEQEQEQVATPPAGEPHTERALHSAFRALQLPSEISEAEFVHFAVQFIFTTYADLQRFQDASDLDYEEDALAASFSADYARALWPDGAPEGDNTSAWLKNLAHFFSVLRRGPYIRGGTTATLEELLFRLVGEERMEASNNPSGHHVDPDTVEAELTEAHRDLGLIEVEDGRVQDFIDLAAAYVFEFYGSLDSESADLQDLGDLYNPGPLAKGFYTTFRIALWEGSEEADYVYDTQMAGLRRFFFALQARNYMREGSVSLRNCLVRLVGLKVANTIKLPGFAQETTGSNPVLSALFVKLDVSQDLPHDRPMLDTF